MRKEEVSEMLDRLKNKDVEELFVQKQDFLLFREVLVNRKDFKHFRGIAQRGGDVVYHYLEEPRS